MRSEIQRTGRRTLRAAQATSAYSACTPDFMPNEPPTSAVSTRISVGLMLKLPFAMPLRRLYGDWCAACTTMRPSAPTSRPCAARLHRVGGDARHGELQPRDMRRRPQRRIGRLGIAALPQKADIVRHVVPHLGRAPAPSRRSHRSPAAVRGNPPSPPRPHPCPRRSFQPAPPPPARRRSARGPPRAAADRSSVPDCRRDAGKPMPPGIGDDVGQVSGGEHRDHTRHGARGRGVDAADRRMRMMRADQHGVQHAGRMRIGAVVALAGQQPHILAPTHRSALHRCHHLFSPAETITSFGGSGSPFSTDCMLAKACRAMSATRSMALPAVCGVTTT